MFCNIFSNGKKKKSFDIPLGTTYNNEELLSLNKDSCQLMELRPGDQLSMELCIESNREVRLRKRKDFRAWAKIVQKFQQKRENELRKRLRSYE